MKKVLMLVMFTLFSTMAYSQMFNEWGRYLKVGYSIGNIDAESVSDVNHLFVEGGVRNNIVGIGLAVGKNNMGDFFSSNDTAGTYYVELKGTASYTVNNFRAYAVGGMGSFFSVEKDLFLEYGFGMGTTVIKPLEISIQVSNFDNQWFLTPSVAVLF